MHSYEITGYRAADPISWRSRVVPSIHLYLLSHKKTGQEGDKPIPPALSHLYAPNELEPASL